LKAEAPGIEFIPASDSFLCPNMKKITLEKLHAALRDEAPVITVPDDVARRAAGCLEKMLELSK